MGLSLNLTFPYTVPLGALNLTAFNTQYLSA